MNSSWCIVFALAGCSWHLVPHLAVELKSCAQGATISGNLIGLWYPRADDLNEQSVERLDGFSQCAYLLALGRFDQTNQQRRYRIATTLQLF
jgi:hypothetical protein